MKCLKVYLTVMLGIGLLGFSSAGFAHRIDFEYHGQTVVLKSYKTLRDDKIVKQNLDYSCGAASVATLLNNYFYQTITEKAVLDLMGTGNYMASFLDMKKALQVLGYEAHGFAASYNTLSTLSSPVIVYIKHRKTDHFSVIRGINDKYVWLADPSLGNRILSKEQFIKVWNVDNSPLAGKVLAIIPKKDQKTNKNYFTNHIDRSEKGSLRLIQSQQGQVWKFL